MIDFPPDWSLRPFKGCPLTNACGVGSQDPKGYGENADTIASLVPTRTTVFAEEVA